ncbi:MAG: hypothetical protein WAN75_00165 [Xanthobacteraceae bacterium]
MRLRQFGFKPPAAARAATIMSCGCKVISIGHRAPPRAGRRVDALRRTQADL